MTRATDLFENIVFTTYLPFSVMIFQWVNSYINYKTKNHLIVNLTAVFVTFHVLSALLFDVSNDLVLLIAAPFSIFYGPVLFFHTRIFYGVPISRREILINGVAIASCVFLYLFMIASEKTFLHYILFGFQGALMIVYGVQELFKKRDAIESAYYGYISVCAILFIIIGTFSLTLSYEIGHYNLTDFYRAPFIKGIYRLLFAILGLIYSCYCLNYLIAKKVKAISISGNSKGDHSVINDNARDIYKKDRLGEESIKKNGQRLDKLMRMDHVYLDSSLNLTKLASLLKISEHNLSQVLNRYVGCSFYKYINQLRIAYAVEVMKSSQGDDISIENIVTQCGYNNRVTFNRYFKEFTGLQPSAYIKQLSHNTDLQSPLHTRSQEGC